MLTIQALSEDVFRKTGLASETVTAWLMVGLVTDPGSVVSLSLGSAVVLFVAGDLPARRAARTEPAVILKNE